MRSLSQLFGQWFLGRSAARAPTPARRAAQAKTGHSSAPAARASGNGHGAVRQQRARHATQGLKLEQQEIPPVPAQLRNHVLWDSRFQRKTFGQIAIEMGLLTEGALNTVLVKQQSDERWRKIGELVVSEGLLDREQVKSVLDRQKAVLYVDERQLGTPQFLTWENDLRQVGIDVYPRAVSPQELAKLMEDGVGIVVDQSSDIDLATLTITKKILATCAGQHGSDVHVLIREKFAEIQLRVKGELKVVWGMTRDEGEAFVRSTFAGLASVKDPIMNPYEFQNAQISGEELPGTGLTSIRVIRGPSYPVQSGGGFMIARLQYKPNFGGQDQVDGIAAFPLRRDVPKRPAGELRLGKMGYTELQVSLLEQMARMPFGLILITGPTGSGKSTTLVELLAHHARQYPGLRQISIEDPVEYPMPWAIQLEVTGAKNDAESGAKFLNLVRMALRMDPDVVNIGELRGAEEAVAAAQASTTGHLVFSTLHVTDPYMSIDRLEMMDRGRLHRNILCSDHKLIRGLIAQRLISILCPHCKKPLSEGDDALPPGMVEKINAWEPRIKRKPQIYIRGDGCAHCGGDGIKDSQAVAEVVMTNAELMRDFVEHGTDVARRKHRKRPGSDLSLLANAMHLVFDGTVDPRDVERSVDVIVSPEEE